MNVARQIIDQWMNLQIVEELQTDKTAQEIYDEKITIASRIFYLLKEI